MLAPGTFLSFSSSSRTASERPLGELARRGIWTVTCRLSACSGGTVARQRTTHVDGLAEDPRCRWCRSGPALPPLGRTPPGTRSRVMADSSAAGLRPCANGRRRGAGWAESAGSVGPGSRAWRRSLPSCRRCSAALLHAWREVAEAVPALVLGVVHGLVGVLQDVGRRLGILREQGDTDAGRHVGDVVAQLEGAGRGYR